MIMFSLAALMDDDHTPKCPNFGLQVAHVIVPHVKFLNMAMDSSVVLNPGYVSPSSLIMLELHPTHLSGTPAYSAPLLPMCPHAPMPMLICLHAL